MSHKQENILSGTAGTDWQGQICACCNNKYVDPKYWLDKTLGYCTDCADVLCLGEPKKQAFSEAQIERMKKSLENI